MENMFLTTKEIALKWGVSATWVTVLCKKGRIEGVIRKGNRWYIPEDAKKPNDRRSCKSTQIKARFRFIDLFAGIGGFHQAMRYLGGECVMAAEINEECKKTYRLNYHTEEKELRGDVTNIQPETIAPFDVLCAGFPCQPFSKAGAQKGFKDKTRGNLFYTIMDILDGHPEAKFIILENVRNLADKTENWDIITSELMRRNFYITEEPIILSPSDFGIPQIRERVYILGIRKDIRNEKILSNGFIHKNDLQLEKHFKKCKMGDAWTILEDNVEDTYVIPEEQEHMILAWDEFRIETGIKVIGFPIWIDSFGVGIDDDNEVFRAQGYDDMPSWKQKFLRHNRKLYLDNRVFIDKWIRKYDMLNKIKLYKKFEWNCGTDVTDIRDCLIQIRQSGIRAKRPTFYPSLVAIVNTPIIWDKNKGHFRRITPREAANLQSFHESLEIEKYWQSRDRMKFDFSISEKVKLEVKATVKNIRTHHFRHEQLMTEVYDIFVLSYLLRYDDEGLSLFELLMSCKKIMANDSRKLLRINYVLKNVEESRLKHLRFNRAYTEANRHIYRAADIPKFRENTPRGVANAEYDCVLDNVEFIEDDLFIDIAKSNSVGAQNV